MDAEQRASTMWVLQHFGISLDDMEANDVLLDLDPNWPGTTVNPKQMKADPAAMRSLADRLDKAVKDIERVPSDLTSGTQPTTFGPDRWASAAAMTRMHRAVSDSVTNYTQLSIRMFTQAAVALRTAADIISGADDQNQANSRNVEAAAGGGQQINRDFWLA